MTERAASSCPSPVLPTAEQYPISKINYRLKRLHAWEKGEIVVYSATTVESLGELNQHGNINMDKGMLGSIQVFNGGIQLTSGSNFILMVIPFVWTYMHDKECIPPLPCRKERALLAASRTHTHTWHTNKRTRRNKASCLLQLQTSVEGVWISIWDQMTCLSLFRASNHVDRPLSHGIPSLVHVKCEIRSIIILFSRTFVPW